MTRNTDLYTLQRRARVCAEMGTSWVYQRRYAGTLGLCIAVREPTKHETVYTAFLTSHYVELTGCSPDRARRDLRRLCASGFLAERKTRGGCTSWSVVPETERVEIGERIIAKLRAKGIPFDTRRM